MATEMQPHRCSVLVVDDDSQVRELLRVALMGDGYHVAAVKDGREALHHLRSHADTCIIVLDLMLPVMDAWQFRAEQAGDPRLAAIPVVIFSANPKVGQHAEALGAAAVIRKPPNLDEIIMTGGSPNTVAELLRTKQVEWAEAVPPGQFAD